MPHSKYKFLRDAGRQGYGVFLKRAHRDMRGRKIPSKILEKKIRSHEANGKPALSFWAALRHRVFVPEYENQELIDYQDAASEEIF